MALPGKLLLGFLQEDNPQKFYFRVRPLVIMGEGAQTPVESAMKDYADDGFIRIVPDKNEISHFKVRMRSLGRYCLMDLRKHPNDNDKIRPNKNYAGESGDRNAYIVYSDVIAKAPLLAAAEVIAADVDADPAGLVLSRPGTPYVMLNRGERLEGPYCWEEVGEEGARILIGTSPAPVSIELSEAAAALIEVDIGEGQTAPLLVGLEQFGIREPVPADKPKPVPADKQIAPVSATITAQPQTVPAQTSPSAQPIQSAPDAQIAPLQQAAAPQPAPTQQLMPVIQPAPQPSAAPAASDAAQQAVTPAPTAPTPRPVPQSSAQPAPIPQPAPPAVPQKQAGQPSGLPAQAGVSGVSVIPVVRLVPQPAPKPATQTPFGMEMASDGAAETTPIPQAQQEQGTIEEGMAKPWLGGAMSFASTRAINGRLNPRMQALQAQCGINPSRGRTIQDVVDEQWRQSRYDQLGHPVPSDVSTRPVMSPIERAGVALREAWTMPDLRERLINEIRSIDELEGALDKARERAAQRPDHSMEALEAERLKLLAEIDTLKKQRQETREQLIDELRKAGNRQIKQLEQSIEQKKQQATEEQAAAERAHAAAQAASESAGRVYGDALDARMADLISEGRAKDLMYTLSLGTPTPARPIEAYHPSTGELIRDVRVYFEAAGLPLTHDEAVNLLAVMTLGGITLLSGPAGSGKSDTARALAGALGLCESGRFVELTAGWDWRRLGEQIVCTSPSGMPTTLLPDARRLLETCDDLTLAVLMIDNANSAPIERYLGELIGTGESSSPRRLATGFGSLPIHPQLRLLMTVEDAPGGCPLTARILDRAFLVRLDLPSAATPWPSAHAAPDADGRAPSLASLKFALDDGRELPGEVEHRLDGIRRQLGMVGVRLSRRAMVDIRRYLSAVLPIMTAGQAAALDLAFAQRALPAILASAELNALNTLPEILGDMPRCMELMRQPLPLPPL